MRGEFEARTWEMFYLSAIEDEPRDAIGARFGVTAAERKAKSRVLHRLKQEVGDLLP